MDQAQKEQKDWAFLLPFFISGASVGAHKFPPFNAPKVIEKALPKQYSRLPNKRNVSLID